MFSQHNFIKMKNEYKIVEVSENYDCGLSWQKECPKPNFIIRKKHKLFIFTFWLDLCYPKFERLTMRFNSYEEAAKYIDINLLK